MCNLDDEKRGDCEECCCEEECSSLNYELEEEESENEWLKLAVAAWLLSDQD